MKIQRKVDTVKLADELGEQYMRLGENAKDLNAQIESVKTKIKSKAGLLGEEEGKRVLIKGNKFAVGYTRCDPTPGVDYEKLFKLIPGLKKRVAKPKVEIDEAEMAAAIKDGTVPAKILSRCLAPSDKKPYDRIVVEEIKKS